MTLPASYQRAWTNHGLAACAAYDLLQTMAENLPRIPGMDTRLRLAVRLEAGHSVETAAAREYAYRWRLALDSHQQDVTTRNRRPGAFAAFYAPHPFGL